MEIERVRSVKKELDPKKLELKAQTIRSFLDFMEGGVDPQFPLGIYIEISNVCNFKCAMCTIFSAVNESRVSDTKSFNRGFIGFDENFRRIAIESLPHFLNVRAFGFGEPTIHPNFKEILSFLADQEVAISFFTNGSKITADLADHIVSSGVAEVALSMTGATAAEYENVYIGGGFQQIQNAIRLLAEAKKRQGKTFPRILINTLSYHHHLKTFDQFVELVGSLGANIVRMAPLVEFEKIPALRDHSHTFGTTELMQVYERAVTLAQKYHVDLWVNNGLLRPDEAPRALPVTPITEVKKLAEKMNFAGVGYTPAAVGSYVPVAASEFVADIMLKKIPVNDPQMLCPEPYRMMYWGQSGRVSPCCHWKPTATALGDVTDASLTDIWQGPAYRSLRAGVTQNSYPKEGCGDCRFMKMTPASDIIGQVVSDYLSWHLERFGETVLQELLPRVRKMEGLRQALDRRPIVRSKAGGAKTPVFTTWDELEKFLDGHAGDDDFLGEIFEGYVDYVEGERVFGWAWAPHFPEIRLPLRLKQNGRVVGEGIANIFRADLRDAKKAGGDFSYSLQSFFDGFDVHGGFDVEIGATGFFLKSSKSGG